MSNICDHYKLYNYLKDNFNNFQKTLHNPEDIENKDENYEGNHIHTTFFREYRRATWYFQYPEVIPGSNLGDNIEGSSFLFSYKIKTASHILSQTDLCQKFPSIQCKPGYKAHWTLNPGSNIFEYGTLTFNDKIIQTLDQTYCDIMNQFLPDNKKNNFNINIGNIPCLQEFSDKIPQYETSFKPPWFYQDISNSFPLYYCSILDKIEHKLILRRNINDLLIVIKEETGEFVDADMNSIAKVNDIDTTNENLILPMPQMWAVYIYLSDMECENNRSFCQNTHSFNDKKNLFLFKDIIKLENDNPISLNNKISIKIPNSEFPVTNISWVAQNQEALNNKFYSNYTTNSNNISMGWSPILNTSLSYGKSLIFKEIPSFRTERVYPEMQCGSMSYYRGYNNWCLGTTFNDENPLPGVVIKDGFITIQLTDTNPYIKLGNTSKSQDTFKFYVYLTCNKRLIFNNFATDEKMRHTSSSIKGGTEITIEGYE